MSEQQPPTGPSYDGPLWSGGSPDYGQPPASSDTVTFGGGSGHGSGEPRRRRTWWYVGGGAVAAVALVAGGTVFAATHLKSDRDPGAAAGLPRDTIAYAGIDLDPSASQKIEAIRALRKFPGFTHGTHLNPTSDLRKMALEESLKSDGCHLDWTKDVASWLGQDVGAAVVPAGSAGPQPVAVLAITDETKARKDLPKLLACDDDSGGVAIGHGWAVIAENDTIAKSVSASAQKATLADDSDFKTWTDRTGDPGVATFYAAKSAGPALAEHVDELGSLFSGTETTSASGSSAFAPAAYTSARSHASNDPSDPFGPSGPLGTLMQMCPRPTAGDSAGQPTGPDKAQLEQLKKELSNFPGAAATLRFAHGGFEVEMVDQPARASTSGHSGPAGLTGLTTLPRDTAIALAGGAPAAGAMDDFVKGFTTGFASQCGTSAASVQKGLEKLTGLSLPGDLDTLFSHGATLAISGKVDAAALENPDPSHMPVGAKLQGDPEKISAVLHKLQGAPLQQVLGTTSGDGVVAVGPDAAYRAELAKKGDLGSSATFQDVIPHADRARAAYFIDFAQLRPVIKALADSDPASQQDAEQADKELAHLKAFGESAWFQGGIEHGLIRVSLQ